VQERPISSRFGRCMLTHWALDPGITYLNHGTVGAPPRCVLQAQQDLRDEIERQPSKFLLRELSLAVAVGSSQGNQSRLRAASDDVGRFLGADGKDLVFVDNATTGVNVVLQSFHFHEGDEILVLEQGYGAVRNAAIYAARSRGATVRVLELPDCIGGDDVVVESVEAAIGPRTRLAVVDHITSDSALALPLAEIAARCRQREVAVLADGAHAPGAVPVDIESLGVDWYTGNLHKWAWAPRSSAVLWTNPDRQTSLHSTVISWGLDQGFTQEFDWPGTRDPTAHLAAPVGIATMQKFGVSSVQRYNHELAWSAGQEMATHWGTTLLGPENMIGPMITVPLPGRLGSTREEAIKLRDALLFEDNIEVHLFSWKGQLRVRVSAQIYNEMSDVERLIDAVDARL
jgi:isopenicillin-N epimerase